MGKGKRTRAQRPRKKSSSTTPNPVNSNTAKSKWPWFVAAFLGLAVVVTGMTVVYQDHAKPKASNPLGPEARVLAYKAEVDLWEYSPIQKLGASTEFQFDGHLCYFDDNGLIRKNPHVKVECLPRELEQTATPVKPTYPAPEDIVRFLDKEGEHARHDRMGTLRVNDAFIFQSHEYRAFTDKESSTGISIKRLAKPSTASSGHNRSIDDEEVTPETWRGIDLEIRKPDGSLAKIGLLRPLWWLERARAEVGGTIYLTMPEMGIEGGALVKKITPCTADSRNSHPNARVVTGKFEHENAIVYDLYFNDDPDEHLGVTPSHPLWSLDRNGWIEAGNLRIRERLRTKDSAEAILTMRRLRPGRHKVYNLEVHKDHTYYVSNLGILAHNSCVQNPKEFHAAIKDKWGETLTGREMRELHEAVKRVKSRDKSLYPHNDGTNFANHWTKDPLDAVTGQRVAGQRLDTGKVYEEWTVRTPGVGNRGARRLIIDRANNKAFYSHDHYKSFIEINLSGWK